MTKPDILTTTVVLAITLGVVASFVAAGLIAEAQAHSAPDAPGAADCSAVAYDRASWEYDASALRERLWATNPYTAYAGQPFDELPTGEQAEVEHVVAIREAHDRGGCAWPRERKARFAGDIRNVVLALPSINRSKGASPDWRPPTVPTWFAYRRAEILKREFGVVEVVK